MATVMYVDLNPVRAGLVIDPKDYRFCGYAQAVAGDKGARKGLKLLFPEKEWNELQAVYRLLLFRRAAATREKGGTVSSQESAKVVADGGKLALGDLLRCRMRYLTDGAVLGSKVFVAEQLAEFQRKTGRGGRTEPRPLPDFEGLSVMRNLRGTAVG